MTLHDTIHRVTRRVIANSRPTRAAYLDLMQREADNRPDRSTVSCSNLAHAYAGSLEDQEALKANRGPNLGIVSAYNDMLSAHQPYGRYPERLKIYAREVGATAQVAGGTPAMCDGVTQGETGMELSLFSRDVIALSTGVALSHAMFDGVLTLGICDKIVPGLLIGALRFGHLPCIFVPSGPMPSGIPNKEKQRVRQLYAEGKVGRAELLESELGSYHSPGTCTFYGTANSNQMMMELMGLHVPGAAFVQPGTKLRQALDREAVHRVAAIGQDGDDYRPLARCVDEKSIVNAAVGLLATGGSTNHAIHLPAMARAAGIVFDWNDLAELSSAVPLLAHVYPNGAGDVNQFHAAGGMGYVVGELLEAGLAHRDVLTVGRGDLSDYALEPGLDEDRLTWREPGPSGDAEMLRPVSDPFQPDGGMRLVEGNLGRACFKSSAVERDRWTIEAPCRVFETQHQVAEAFKAGELDRDVIVVVRFQGPRANGMPELHKLTPPLGVLQDRGYRVALITDGRMSGASGKVPAAIHCTPEALGGGPLARLRDGDTIRLCAASGELSTTADLDSRDPAPEPRPEGGTGRELFAMFRNFADSAEKGGSAMLATAGL
ncbi:phosphogluconate dehydratase [Pelagerythrobacter marinus]|uniref:phosphogluconate dehydratase n=1 Tax=Pelagerythrobacter marinus TaxID=538382 RepID=UPI002036B7EE|nr:phosphogluconate dehydratase [Pelagerythrobacter marinus]USA39845.1 phosphogluconate dehydratase [Pelagerythrobacter marinus]WPZ06024.1 phosphogluconate dehydratase [Pelagerythrobacter marinus]